MKTPKKNIIQAFAAYYGSAPHGPDCFYKYPGTSIIEACKYIYALGGEAAKDYLDTFKPYKASYAQSRDYLQPFTGLVNLAHGLLSLLMTPLMLAADLITFLLCIVSGNGFENRFEPFFTFFAAIPMLVMTLALTAFRLAESMALMIRGISQLLTSPLSWFVKIPLRSLITDILGAPKIEENEGMRKLLNELQDNPGPEVDINTYVEIHRKFRKQRERGQATDLLEENSTFAQLNTALFNNRARYNRDENGINRMEIAHPSQALTQAMLAYHQVFFSREQGLPVYGEENLNPPPHIVV